MQASLSDQKQAVIKKRYSPSGMEWTGNRALPVPRTCNSCPYLTRIEIVVAIKQKNFPDKNNAFFHMQKKIPAICSIPE